MALEFLLIRHAQSEWNAAGRWQGHGDPPLSPKGLLQAEGLAEKLSGELSGEPWDRVLSSDLRRARETGAAVAQAMGLELELEPRLRELDIGDWTGLTREEIAAQAPDELARFEAVDLSVRPGGGESRARIRERSHGVISQLHADTDRQRIVVVTHLGFIRALVPGGEPTNCEYLRFPADELLSLRSRAPIGGEAPENAPL